MARFKKLTRRDFLKETSSTAAAACLGGAVGVGCAKPRADKSTIFKVDKIPVHDNYLRHLGIDNLMGLMGNNDLKLYSTRKRHPWGGSEGIIEQNDIVLIKVNCQWKFRGATNTDVLRGLIHRILEHPDGFNGEIVIFENGQLQGSFDGDPRAWGRYDDIPEAAGVHVNAEDPTLTVDRLVNEVFANSPVSSYLLDPLTETFIEDDDHLNDGYRRIEDAQISYPCFTSKFGRRIELREGIWNGKNYEKNIKLINLPVLKTHFGNGLTGALKNSYGILSMRDNNEWRRKRHYEESGCQCGKMYSLVRMPDLNVVDAIWVTYKEHHRGYPDSTTHRSNMLLGGLDPVALDYHASKHILLPLGGDRPERHDPESDPILVNHLTGALEFMNAHGGIKGKLSNQGDENIEVISRSVV